MKEFNLNEENNSQEPVAKAGSALPAKVGLWSKISGFLFQEIDLNKPIVLELTPKEEKVLSYSITDIDIQIRRESKYKGMGLDFFKLDDEQFESRFQSVINDERIYVVGKSREETTYRLLNELRQKNSDRVTLIIKSEEEWNKPLKETYLMGYYLQRKQLYTKKEQNEQEVSE